ncbi:MAG: tetratricopeptide repeat protein [Lewinellaceae bacterium]|nr:tetratricopeptide repeat protein [Lewinellaceae bacterium]
MENMDSLRREEHPNNLVLFLRSWWPSLVALLVLSVAALWFNWRPPLHERLFTKYMDDPKAAFLLRGGGDETAPDMTPAADAFNQGDYQNALNRLSAYLPNYPNDMEARLFAGLCYLKLQRYQDAQGAFRGVTRTKNAWTSEAYWYMALAYLRENKRIECIQALGGIPENSDRHQKALEIWQQIR